MNIFQQLFGNKPDTNFANTNLEANSRRVHDFKSNSLDINNVKSFFLSDAISYVISIGDSGSGDSQSTIEVKSVDTTLGIGMLPSELYKYFRLYAESLINKNRNQIYITPGIIEFKNIDTNDGVTFKELSLFLRALPICESETDAIAAGFETDIIYKTSTGELRIKL